ncbi:MAG: proline racemase family protein [Bacteroidetes bacterium]|nr:proline racemase family protein [Bacteroidota bacterium]
MSNHYEKLKALEDWEPPKDWIRIKSLDAHTGGEPLRIITSGLPDLEGDTIIAKRRFMKENYDNLRRALMFEPKGHADQYGAIIVPPVTEEADFGAIFTHNEGYSTMCGHAIIAMTKVVLETGMIHMVEPVTTIKIDAPAGLITSHARIKDGKVQNVYFHNVPSFVLLADQIVDVPGLGKVKFDVAYGGAFYAFVKAEEVGADMTTEGYRGLIEKGMAIKNAVMDNFEIKHPFEEDLSFLYGTIFYGDPINEGADSRNVCIFAEGEVDRSPTGTGVSARMALHFAKGELGLNESYVIESILGSSFKCKAIKETTFGPFKAVIPEVEGNAHISGKCEFFIDPEDPLRDGFILR